MLKKVTADVYITIKKYANKKYETADIISLTGASKSTVNYVKSSQNYEDYQDKLRERLEKRIASKKSKTAVDVADTPQVTEVPLPPKEVEREIICNAQKAKIKFAFERTYKYFICDNCEMQFVENGQRYKFCPHCGELLERSPTQTTI